MKQTSQKSAEKANIYLHPDYHDRSLSIPNRVGFDTAALKCNFQMKDD